MESLSLIYNDDLILLSSKEIEKDKINIKYNEISNDNTQKKELAVFIDYKINEQENEFLKNVLKAINFSLDEVNIYFENPIKQEYILNNNLFFGAFMLNDSMLESEKYVIEKIGQSNFLICDSLVEVIKVRDKKGALWNALKIMFNIN